jgi:hypothetical protein
MNRVDAWRMVQRRAADLGVRIRVGCHTFRATGITAYLEAGGTLENAQAMAYPESARRRPVVGGASPPISTGDRPSQRLACGATGLVQFMGRTPGPDEKHDRQPLWHLEVSHNFRTRRRRLDPSRAGRARPRRNLLDRDPTAEAGTNLRLPHRRGRGGGTRGARRRRRFQRSHARSRVWRRLVHGQRRCDLFLEQYRSAALSSGCGPAAEPDHACSSRRGCGCAPVRRWGHRPPPGTHGLCQGGSHWRRRGDHDASHR